MKRRLIICSSLITIILSCFSFPIFAEETVQDSSNLHSLSDGVFLDSYFYDNYELLPYIESNSNQYIDIGVKPSSDIGFELRMSDFKLVGSTSSLYLFGVNESQNIYGAYVVKENNSLVLRIANTLQSIGIIFNPYQIHNISILGNSGYFDNELIVERQTDYSFNINLSLFARNNNGSYGNLSSYKLYSFKVIDYSLNNGEGEYIRYYYPAKAKTSGSIGLYDAVSKTFIVSGSSTPFSNPTNEYVENFQISSFLTASLGWIGQIFTAIIDMPIIIVFMAIGLAGAMFRWGRRIVHF